MARMTLDAFRKRWLGKALDWWSSSPKPQCVDLVREWMHRGLGISKADMYRAIPRGDAKTFYKNASSKFFSKVAYRKGRVPPKGAIVVWNHGKYGHVAIAKKKCTTDRMRTLDQNWSIDHRVTDEAHRYVDCIGWLVRR